LAEIIQLFALRGCINKIAASFTIAWQGFSFLLLFHGIGFSAAKNQNLPVYGFYRSCKLGIFSAADLGCCSLLNSNSDKHKERKSVCSCSRSNRHLLSLNGILIKQNYLKLYMMFI